MANGTQSGYHRPVLVDYLVEALVTDRSGTYVDGTLGDAGHTRALLERLDRRGCIVALDVDGDALQRSRQRLADARARVVLKQASFADLSAVLHNLGTPAVHGILCDLGVSSHQIDTPRRGFSFQRDEPLDMRMDQRRPRTARDLVMEADRNTLRHLLRTFGEERAAGRIAAAIVHQRAQGPIETTGALRDLVARCVPARHLTKSLARVFQALRIAVNDELAALEHLLAACVDLLLPGARIAMVSYHSLEDRLVKQAFRRYEQGCVCPPRLPACVCGRTPSMQVLTRRPVRPGNEEVAANPRARSARLRVAERV